ncbi:hypothetical protein EYC84_006871 [Monilinia fructicola]|nr:hypothetical protein EYC84_006871 [Monilinia fructicola]
MADLQIHANLTIAAAAVFIPVCSATVGLRVYARHLKKVGLGADDYLIMAALVFVIGMGIAIMTEVGLKQLGYPAPAHPPKSGNPIPMSHFGPENSCRFLPSASTIVEKEHCVDTSKLHNAFAISDVVTDFIIISLPVPMIFGLHLTVARKIGILAIFSLGALTIAASIVRMTVFIQATAVNYDPHADFEFICTSGLYCVQSAISLRSMRSSSQHPSNENGANGSERNMYANHMYGNMHGGMETKLEPWTTGHGSDTQHITAHAEGPARYEREGELENGFADAEGEGLKSKRVIVVTNSFESREGLA